MPGIKAKQKAVLSTPEELQDEERHQPGLIRKYLDLADMLIRRAKQRSKSDTAKPKAA